MENYDKTPNIINWLRDSFIQHPSTSRLIYFYDGNATKIIELQNLTRWHWHYTISITYAIESYVS